jgi:hypothetical protein
MKVFGLGDTCIDIVPHTTRKKRRFRKKKFHSWYFSFEALSICRLVAPLVFAAAAMQR